jgi:outer membrane protein OmpA-like peptidoglycan-associated protein
MSRLGKCTNFSGCLLAYRGEETSVADGQPFICAECGKPLSEVKAPAGRWIIYGVVGIVAVALIGGIAVALPKILAKKPSTNLATPTPGRTTPTTGEPSQAADTPPVVNPDKVGDAEPPTQVVAEKDIKLNIDQKVKDEVLKRVELAPLSAKEKDKLYIAVEKAKKMGLVITVPFGKGKAILAPGDALALKDAFEQPEIAKLRDNPFAVFVVLGYADPKGDPEANKKTSRDRAVAVVASIEKDVSDKILVRAVGMGGTTLLDDKNLEKNRIAEVWVVLP